MTPELEGEAKGLDELERIYKEEYLVEPDHEVWDTYLSLEALEGFFDDPEAVSLFHLRFKMKDGNLEWHRVCLEAVDEEHLVLVSSNIQKEIRNRAIGKAVDTEFDYVAYISILDGSYLLYHSTGGENSMMPPMFHSNYHKILWEYNEMYVADGEGAALSQLMEIEAVTEMLKSRKDYVLFCTVKDEAGELYYKKLRFCYLDDKKDVLLLSRVDITDITREHQLRLEAEQKEKAANQELADYLNHMPMGCCTTKIIEDETGRPCDFEFVYSNYAHSRIEGAAYGELIGKRFYEFFKETDPFWLSYYADTAYNGGSHTLDHYSPEIGRHLLIHTFQTQPGYCGCILQDITEKKMLSRALEENQRRMQSFLKSTADYIFQYDTEEQVFLMLLEKQQGEHSQEARNKENPLEKLSAGEVLGEDALALFNEKLASLKEQGREVDFTAKMTMKRGEGERWYQVTLFIFWDCESRENHIFGYLQDINDMVLRQESLQKEAQRDPLTGIYNAKTGRERIEAKLLDTGFDGYYLMFIMDLDEFKAINDQKGHMAGDRALIQFAQVISRSFRRDDVYYRLGGDEFAAFISVTGDPKVMAETIMARFFGLLNVENSDEVVLKSSVGIFAGKKKADFTYYYKKADEALYEAKHRGKNQFALRMEEK